MFTFATIKIVRFGGYRTISYVVSKNFVGKYSSLGVEKNNESHTSNYHLQKCLLASKCRHIFLKTSGLHRSSKHRSTHSANAFRSFLASGRHYQTKSKDCNKEDDPEIQVKARNVLDDLEFQSILKDFAQDFGVNEDSHKFLEEIKQKGHGAFGDETEQPPSKTECSDHKLNLKNIKLKTDLTLSEHQVSGSSVTDPNEDLDLKQIQEDSADEFFHIDQELERSVECDAKRGTEGVYDIGELVAVLKEENLLDISVIQVPEFLHYTDYLVLATARSPRHCNAVVEFIVKLYKKKKSENDPFLTQRSREKSTWRVFDMGNIVLHIFLDDTRDFYDIESLWLLDRKYDSARSVKSDPNIDILQQQQLDFLNNLNIL